MRRLLVILGLMALGLAAGAFVSATFFSPRQTVTREAVKRPAPRPSTPRVETRRAEAAPPAERGAARRAPAAPAAAARSSAAATDAPVPVPTTGVLDIESDVPGAQVFIDRQFIGAAPITGYEIKPGSHRVNVSATGFEGVVETINVAPGPRRLTIKLREVRLEASLDVIHKHRFGSCKGRLIATPLGVRYQTTDKDDAFTAALLDIESFEVDYLKKNLKLKLRKGKTFDFTDPEGNADRLFVFHRDVDHARDRLKRGDPPATK